MSTGSEATVRQGMPGLLLGMIIFITSEIMFFGGLFGAYFSLRAGADVWPPDGIEVERLIPSLLTVVLLASSATVHNATAAARRNDGRTLRRTLGATIALGLLFLAGQAFEYSRLDFVAGDGAFASTFYATTGFHGLHVLIGVIILALARFELGRRGPDSRQLGRVEAAAYYWHFVDAVWIIVFTSIYLIQ
ncbi:MAG: cytochrome c oxidase subunit 3 [Actinomycetota bacterium]